MEISSNRDKIELAELIKNKKYRKDVQKFKVQKVVSGTSMKTSICMQ